ncbi:RICIN domain-containing protein [Paractinoplanes lichenicola]|uniref:RICIN domain-containing protein n=1 Tax=Paractinoplanes lichenicola TaxID=2802976 RepID=A0ABS1VT48_9ACTN|nr:RICIN domain-containing protein [Actinoplanes lichenicola]MBL7257643.1 RICIN domain-containing protein [Actinoplanes lichenicola]
MRRSSAFLTALVTATLPALLMPIAPAQASPPLTDRPAPASLPLPAPAAGEVTARKAPGGDVVRGKPENAAPVDLVGLDFQLINAASRWCLTAELTELPCATTDPYRWRFRPADATGTFEILSVRANRCLTMPGATTTPGARAGLAPCAAVPSRRWQLRDAPGDTAKVVNTRTGKCLQIQSGVAVQDSCAGNQGTRRWTVRVVGLPFIGTTRTGK